jgi:REP element-mobilizing transposase RayT
MGRKPRIYFPGAFYHLLNRGNQRQPIFHDERDYQAFWGGLAETANRYQLRIHAYCLMPNHFHLLAEVDLFSPALAMRSLETAYARAYNRRYQKVGHVFQGRYRGILCEKASYLLALVRYLHWNPVRARLVSRPEDWAWSSHRAFLGMAQNDWLFQKEVLSAFGSKGVGWLVEFLGDPSALGPHPEFYKPERFPVLSNSAGSVRIPAGQEPSRRGGSWELSRGRMGLKRIGDTLSSAWGLPTEQVLGKGGERNVSRVREEICFAATHFFHYPSIKIAQYLGVSPSGVTRMMRRAQKDLWTDKTHLQRIKGLLLLG